MNPFGQQNFFTGCNYWASHAGTDMWSKWEPETIRQDFRKLKDLQLDVVRLFPLWPEFQPLTSHSRVFNTPYQLRWRNGEEIPFDADGRRSGVDPVMLERFRFVCDCALEHGLKVGVGLITGWMSGKIFAPPAFQQKNLLRDPLVIRWQMKFVRRFVSEFKDHPAILFWGVGNECNCLDSADRFEGAMWTRTISETIRAVDPERPILAGLHGITPQASDSIAPSKSWSISDMAEDFDVLTVHPYPLFTPHAGTDRITGIKAAMHATAEAHFFGDIGRRPCVAEELGTLAPTVAGENSAAEYLKNTLYQLWVHDCEGLFWWCAFEQSHLEHPPYQWCAVERMLGLFHQDGTPKPVANVLRDFAEMRKSLPFEKLPPFRKEIVCILTGEQDSWMAAYGAWNLAKQAGVDLEFQYEDEPLRNSDFYLLPMITGLDNLPRNKYLDLMENVKNGATLVCSFDGACLAPFNEFFGLNAKYQENYAGTLTVPFKENLTFPFQTRITLESEGAEILLSDSDGAPFLARNRYGKGSVYFLSCSPERAVIQQNREIEKPYYELYRLCFAEALQKRCFDPCDPGITATIHPETSDTTLAVLLNIENREKDLSSGILSPDWEIAEILAGDYPLLPPHKHCILRMKRKK